MFCYICICGWLGGDDGKRPMGKFGQNTLVKPLLYSTLLNNISIHTKGQKRSVYYEVCFFKWLSSLNQD